jgi:hypothetical protein
MSWVIAIGLTLIAAFLVVSVVVQPTAIAAWLQGFAVVAVMALVAIGERRHRRGRTIWSGVSNRAVTWWALGLGVLFSAVGIVLIARESYLVAAFNLVGGAGMLVIGAVWLALLPNRTVERDARKNDARPSL